MFYALTHDKLDTHGLKFVHQLEDIETLNRRALDGELEVSAISIHAFAHLADRYALLASGCSMGDRYGPMLITREPATLDEIRGQDASPSPGPSRPPTSRSSSAWARTCRSTVMPFDQILPAVAEGRADVGLIIHEGQLYYGDKGLHKVIDLGQWWFEQTGLPLPLGGNVVRKDLGDDLVNEIARLLKASIVYALDHRAGGPRLRPALRPRPRPGARRPLRRHVRQRVDRRLRPPRPRGRPDPPDRAVEAGLVPAPVDVQFVG